MFAQPQNRTMKFPYTRQVIPKFSMCQGLNSLYWDYIEDGHPTFNRWSYYWVDDHPLLIAWK